MNQELMEIKEIPNVVKELMKLQHLSRLGEVGIFAILCKAKALKMDLMDALSGGLYSPKPGIVEMAAVTMSALIRNAGHSIKKDESECDPTKCTLIGVRADNGDRMSACFTIEQARIAGLLSKENWKNYPEDMLYTKALGRLGRQLFADVIKGCYVQGEIDLDKKEITVAPEPEILISEEQATELKEMFGMVPEYAKIYVPKIITAYAINDLSELPLKHFVKVKAAALYQIDKKNKEVNNEC